MSNINTKAGGNVTSVQLGSANEHHEIGLDGQEDQFGDLASIRNAFHDPRYRVSENFRRQIADAMAQTMLAAGSTPNSQAGGTVRIQAIGNPIDQAWPADRTLTDHEIAMIEKAQRHGL